MPAVSVAAADAGQCRVPPVHTVPQLLGCPLVCPQVSYSQGSAYTAEIEFVSEVRRHSAADEY